METNYISEYPHNTFNQQGPYVYKYSVADLPQKRMQQWRFNEIYSEVATRAGGYDETGGSRPQHTCRTGTELVLQGHGNDGPRSAEDDAEV